VTHRPGGLGHAEAEAGRPSPAGHHPIPPAATRAPLVPEPHAISAPLPEPEPITPPLPVKAAPEPADRRRRKKKDDDFVDWVSGLGGE
jgi:hypothetical protein